MQADADHAGARPPLDGVRVLEIGQFASAPSCATVLSDWGADVIKIEQLAGDPARGPGSMSHQPGAPNPRFDVHNRSRRSVALNLAKPAGNEVAHRLIGDSDVLVTNLRPGSLHRLGLSPQGLRQRHPRLVIAHITGYGADTALAEERSYDHGAFWSYSGVASMFTPPGGQPPQPAGGFGDRATGSVLAGAICAALLGASRTGHGAYITTSLVNTGLWLMASDVADATVTAGVHHSRDRRHAPIPTLNSFRTADGKWLWLQVMLPERDWPRLLAALEAPWLDDDPRFRGGGAAKLVAVSEVLTEAFDEIFRRRSLADWGARLSGHGLMWAPVRSLPEVLSDPEILASSAFTEVIDRDGVAHLSVNTPCSFADVSAPRKTTSPSVGEHTEAVLRALGYTEQAIGDLAACGAIGLPQIAAAQRQASQA